MPDIRVHAVAVAVAAASFIALPAAAAPDTASAAAFGKRTLKRGMHGKDVRTAQVLLKRTGEDIAADGAFGRATERAVRGFEEAADLDGDGRLQRPEAPRLREVADATQQAKTRGTGNGTMVANADGGVDPATGAPLPADPTDPAGGATPTLPAAVPGATAVLNPDGTATAPASAPDVVKQIIASGNEIASTKYRYGGGHGRWKDSGYDCSGSVSYALHGAGLLDESMPSGAFESWGLAGRGTWVTIYAKGSHMYMVVAGLRFDTSGAKPSRWQTDMRSSRGYTIRHPDGL